MKSKAVNRDRKPGKHVFILLFPLLMVSHLHADDGRLSAWSVRIEKAHYSSDIEAMQLLGSEIENWDGKSVRGLYCLAFVHTDIGVLLDLRGKEGAEDHYERALASLARADSMEAHADIRALAAYVIGLTMDHVSFFGQISLVRKFSWWLGRAYEADSTNPRVWMVDGISRIYRPGIAGGGADRARERFLRAITLWEDPGVSNKHADFWGGPEEIYAWWGYLEIREGNHANALRCLERALSIRPQYIWVQKELMPLLDAKTSQ